MEERRETSAAPDVWCGWNPLDPAFRDDPHPALRRLRELDPVNETPLGIWRLTRYDDVVCLLREVPSCDSSTPGSRPSVVRTPAGISRSRRTTSS